MRASPNGYFSCPASPAPEWDTHGMLCWFQPWVLQTSTWATGSMKQDWAQPDGLSYSWAFSYLEYRGGEAPSSLLLGIPRVPSVPGFSTSNPGFCFQDKLSGRSQALLWSEKWRLLTHQRKPVSQWLPVPERGRPEWNPDTKKDVPKGKSWKRCLIWVSLICGVWAKAMIFQSMWS